ncbi:MAG: plasmid stability protein [Verrucomicrobia bacterium]|nr:plasmid stability protein [Verrucomicrobiota bacterium]
MATLTLKDVPNKLHVALKQRADYHRRSLNQEVLYCLERVAGLVRTEPKERQVWLDASEQSLMRVWDNPEDDVYNELLKK